MAKKPAKSKPRRKSTIAAASQSRVMPRAGGRRSKRRRRSDGAPKAVKGRASAAVKRSKSGADDQPHALPAYAIVGIGASAGGLEACTQLLQALPKDAPLAIIIVQHLAPDHDSSLPELLGARSKLPVDEITDDMPLERGHVYVMPPNAQLGLMNERLRLTPRPLDRSQHMPIDYFFHTLAESAQSRAIGIVLSGNASDGALGLREIKAAGGVTIAQKPASAGFDGMPRAAINAGAVDLVLEPRQIAVEINRLARLPIPLALFAESATTRDDELFGNESMLGRIFLMLRHASGVDFTHYKSPTVRRRLHRRMVLHRLQTLDEYVHLLKENPAEVKNLYQDLLIHVTRFFREPNSFELLRKRVFPGIVAQRHHDEPLRVWVPGCSTGEEAYSVTIALLEFLGDRANNTPVQVFATDVSEQAIDQARAGVYPESITADVSSDRLRLFFNKVDGHYRIAKPVRDLCIFARQDITRDPPFSRMDLIVCRNVLIYLGPVLQRKVMNVFHYALKPKGFLMLGSAETVGPHGDLFGVADKRHKLYHKSTAVVLPSEVNFPVDRVPVHETGRRSKRVPSRPATSLQSEINRILLARYAPPGVVVDSDLRIVEFRGQTGPYLEPAPGEASLDLLKMAREGLLYGLRTALNDVQRTGKTVRMDNLRVKNNGHAREVSLEIIPLAPANEGRHFMILFHSPHLDKSDSGGTETSKPPTRRARGRARDASATHGEPKTLAAAQQQVARLEQELAASREYLQAMIQDLEAANEELQSANEEILSSNEELQSTNEELDTAKEELQSTNEELNTVNEELQGRNEELSRVNSDQINLLASVQIAIVMVSSDLRIRRFTPMAERVLNLIPTDIGRPISDIKPNIDVPDLEQLITAVADSMSVNEREVTDRQGRRYMLRVRPYKNLDNRIDGAVLALFDSTTIALAGGSISGTGSGVGDGDGDGSDAEPLAPRPKNDGDTTA